MNCFKNQLIIYYFISRFLSSISKKLKEAKIIDNHVETNDFIELGIKKIIQ